MRRLVLAGVTVLVLATVAFFAARSEGIADPRPSNVLPSGLGALTELLKADGFDVRVDVTDRPSAPSDSLVVACLVTGNGFMEFVRMVPDGGEKPIEDHLKKGGNVLALLYEPDFVQATSQARMEPVGGDRQVWIGRLLDSPIDFSDEWPDRAVVFAGARELVTAVGVEEGTMVTVRSALFTTNRFLSRDDDAAFALELFRKTAGPSKRVVFFLSTLGLGQSRGIIGSIGNWAAVLQWQVFIVLGAMAWTVSRRFGLPEETASFQRGARQLSDSLAEVLRAGKKRPFAAKLIADQAVRTTRTRLRLPPSATIEDILKKSDRETREAYGRVLSSSEERGPQAVLTALRQFLAKIGIK
ncbi:MAG: hypothetical protein JST30_11155 [Armatimonadetes bacterium]|nr:hypothetical protein [Armatimonadota bacterium]